MTAGGEYMKKSLKLTIVILLLLCLTAAAAFVTVKKHQQREAAREAAEQAAQQEAERQAAEKAAEEAAKEAEAAAKAKEEAISAEKGEWYLILVNSDNAMPDDFDIETAEVEDGYVIDSRVKEPLQQMLADCREAGFSPRVISTFRTRETQQYLYDHTANKADTAIPGHSEHECGLAADIIDADSLGWSDPLIAEQEDMPAQKWLMQHCHEYGFILRYPKDKEDITQIIYEPWHYRYVGKKHAAAIMQSGICLEEYLSNMETYYDPE